MSVLQRHAAALGKPSPLDQLGARVACPCPFPADGPKNPVLGSLFVSHRLAAVHQSPLVTRAQSREGRVPTRTSPPTPRHARKGSLAGIPGGEQPAQLCVVACQEAEQRWLTPLSPTFSWRRHFQSSMSLQLFLTQPRCCRVMGKLPDVTHLRVTHCRETAEGLCLVSMVKRNKGKDKTPVALKGG